jgi:NAD(P)-dependent dehydrogenase (short-subunit alcohol dehydrogenase family)
MSAAIGKVILVTGATDGIGKETAKILARRGAHVVVHGRSQEKAEAAKRDIERETGKKLEGAVHADLASLDEVRAIAKQWGDKPLDVLVNNAGVYMKKRTLTPDGREMTMAVNHDAPFLLTHLLLPHLKKAPQGRVVNVSSIAHGRGRIDVDDIDLARSFDGYGAYASSKLANVLFSVELAKRLKGTNVTVNALHPGVVSTKLLKAGFGMGGPDSHEEGAATSVHLALDDVSANGKYFVASRESMPQRPAFDEELCRRFYEESCKRVGIEGI